MSVAVSGSMLGTIRVRRLQSGDRLAGGLSARRNVQMPNLPSLYGAMLADVGVVAEGMARDDFVSSRPAYTAGEAMAGPCA